MNWAEFHFLRPEWFYALIPAVLIFIIIRLRQGTASSWEKTIDPALLPYLLEDHVSTASKVPRFLILFGWIIAVIALAGPVWEKTPQPVHEREDALVILFDLSRSMYATDVKPNRLVRARRKLLDLLEQRTEGVTALVVYAGDAHIVSPLTDDAKTIAELIPAVSPEIMPAPGSQLAPALGLAKTLFEDAGMGSGRILIITDEIRDVARAQTIAREFRVAYPVSVLAVGTPEGAPILDPKLGFLKDASSKLIIPPVDLNALQEFATVAGGRFAHMTLIDSDLEYLLAEEPLDLDESQFREVERDFDIWFEEGPWLLLLLLPIAALSFRRGWVWSIALLTFLPVDPAQASIWDDLWYTSDQQGVRAMAEDAPDIAATKFKDPQWKATAQYRAGNFAEAAEHFNQSSTSDGLYNLGNSLAKQKKYEEAIKAYEDALALSEDNEDAAFNKALVEKLLEQQQQQQGEGEQDQQQDNEQQDSEDSSEQEQNQDQSEGDQQQQQDQDAEEQESEEQQQTEQQEQEQQEQEAKDQQMSEADAEPLDEEQQQALEQWLRRVPDDPGGLLRRKFEMQHQERLKQGKSTEYDSSNW